MRGDYSPALLSPHPGLALPSLFLAVRHDIFNVRGAEFATIGRQHGANGVARWRAALRRPRSAISRDFRVAIQVLGISVSNCVRAIPEKLIQNLRLVGDESRFVALECLRELPMNFRKVDLHRVSPIEGPVEQLNRSYH